METKDLVESLFIIWTNADAFAGIEEEPFVDKDGKIYEEIVRRLREHDRLMSTTRKGWIEEKATKLLDDLTDYDKSSEYWSEAMRYARDFIHSLIGENRGK